MHTPSGSDETGSSEAWFEVWHGKKHQPKWSDPGPVKFTPTITHAQLPFLVFLYNIQIMPQNYRSWQMTDLLTYMSAIFIVSFCPLPHKTVQLFFTSRQMSVVHLSRSRALQALLILNSVGAFDSWQDWQYNYYSLISPVDRTHLFYLLLWIIFQGNL